MLRRAALVAVTLVLLSTSSALAATSTITMLNTGFVPTDQTVALGNSVNWHNSSTKKHTATPNVVWYWASVTVRPGRTSSLVTFNQAGRFPYHCAIHPRRKGTITVPMTVAPLAGTTTTYFKLTLGTVAAPGVLIHDVYVRLNGGAWQLRSATAAATTSILLTTPGTWELHTRMRHLLGGSTSGWTPIVTVSVS
jgi:plastocyanin